MVRTADSVRAGEVESGRKGSGCAAGGARGEGRDKLDGEIVCDDVASAKREGSAIPLVGLVE